MRGGVAGMQTIRESTRAWGKSEMKTFSTFCEGTQPLKTTLLGGTWRNRNTPTSLSSCQGFPDASRGKELIDAAPGVSLPGPRGAGWECRLTAQIGPKGHPLIVCWVCASGGRVFWILCKGSLTTWELHWGLQKVNQRWEIINDLDTEVQRVWLNFIPIRLWGVLCQCSF